MWIPPAMVMSCLAGTLALAASWSPGGELVSRPTFITLLAALMFVAVGVTLCWSMGLRQRGMAIRLIILVPIVLMVVLTVALMLDTQFRGPDLADSAGGR